MEKSYKFEAIIQKVSDIDEAYIAVPFDIKNEFGKGCVKVRATFDGVPYDSSIVNMGVKNPDGSICYIIGIRKDIRAKIGKQPGDAMTSFRIFPVFEQIAESTFDKCSLLIYFGIVSMILLER